MSIDLDDEDEDRIARVAGRRPRLVLAAHRASGTRALWIWSTLRIGATVSGGVAQIERRYGQLGAVNRVRLDLVQIRAVLCASRAWSRARERFAAFYSVGYPGGYGGEDHYLPPHAEDPIRMGRVIAGAREGDRIVGHDEVVRLAGAIRVAPGVHAVAEIWRRGERFGPRDGSRVGERWDLGEGLRLEVGRRAMLVRHRRGEVLVEDDELGFLRALARAFGPGC